MSEQVTGKSLEEVIKKCKIDLKKWDVESFSTKELSSGDYLWTVYFKHRKNEEFNIESFKKELLKYSPEVPKINYKNNGKLLLEVAVWDHHLGKLAHFAETGDNYDLKIASALFRDAVDYTISQVTKYEIDKICLPVGQDFLNSDNLRQETTAGTRQDNDSRFSKIFTTGRKLLVEDRKSTRLNSSH